MTDLHDPSIPVEAYDLASAAYCSAVSDPVGATVRAVWDLAEQKHQEELEHRVAAMDDVDRFEAAQLADPEYLYAYRKVLKRRALEEVDAALHDAGIDYPTGAHGVRDLTVQRDVWPDRVADMVFEARAKVTEEIMRVLNTAADDQLRRPTCCSREIEKWLRECVDMLRRYATKSLSLYYAPSAALGVDLTDAVEAKEKTTSEGST